jgi:hypothetical protein
MQRKRHGITLGMIGSGSDFYLDMKIAGKLTHADYNKMIPFIENAIAHIDEPHIKALVDARELEGFELQAAWDDLKFGLKHGAEFSKIAYIGNRSWEKLAINVTDWFTSSEIEYFEDLSLALVWLHASDDAPQPFEDAEHKEIDKIHDSIIEDMESFFNDKLAITSWDVPENDETKSTKLILQVMQEGLDKLKEKYQA